MTGANADLVDMCEATFGELWADLRGTLTQHATDRYSMRNVGMIRRVVVHHSDTPPTTKWTSIASYHVNDKDHNWPGIGYHFGVEPTGRVVYLGDVETIRYHARQANTTSIGVCCLGDYQKTAPPAAMLYSLRRLIDVLNRWRSAWAGGPLTDTIGHRDAVDTTCPGDKLYAALGKLNEKQDGKDSKIMTKVYDIDGTEKDLDWLRETWDGCEVLPARILPGNTEYWQLAAIFCTSGPAVLKAEVGRDATTPAGNQPVVATWPHLGNPSEDLDILPVNPHNWSTRGVIQRTETNGITGFGLGGGKQYDEDGKEVEAYGPWYHMWVLSSAPSDCLSKTGMMGGTNHNGPLHGVWMLTAVVTGTLEEVLVAKGQQEQKIQFNPRAALQSRIFADGFVPNSGEFDVEHGGVRYVAQRAEHLGTGVVRIYYCRHGVWTPVLYVVKPAE